jgi:hypothetical protein
MKHNKKMCSKCNVNVIPPERATYQIEPALCNYCSMLVFGKKGRDYDGTETNKIEEEVI